MKEAVLFDEFSNRWRRFQDPRETISVYQLEEVVSALERVEERVSNEGLTAVGFIGYEAAPAFDDAFYVRSPGEMPLLSFGLFAGSQEVSLSRLCSTEKYQLGTWRRSISVKEYSEAIAAVKSYLACGDTYQVNFSYRLLSQFSGDPWFFFQDLVSAQQSKYAAYLLDENWSVCSASPELFFRLDGENLVSCPMKGTAARGRTLAEDSDFAEALRYSKKNRAENIMIVDMIRNDMARVSEVGSVQVPDLFEVEKYPTLWQMTSTVESKTSSSVCEILKALFPCASITGAPKARTMEIIAELESAPRGVYTGAIGYIAPERKALFNVAIRTAMIDLKQQTVEFGAGGGIVWDSVCSDELDECGLKSQIVLKARPEFSLLETLLWTQKDGYFLLEQHLKRLRDSAEYFSVPMELEDLRKWLFSQSEAFTEESLKIRLLVDLQGRFSCERSILDRENAAANVKLGLAVNPVNSKDPFLYHKTTNRVMYEAALRERNDCEDVVLFNERGEITESCFANIVLKRGGQFFTPPVSSGLLAGTYRAWLLEQGQIREKLLHLEDLASFEGLYLINSVRTWRKAELNTEMAAEEVEEVFNN